MALGVSEYSVRRPGHVLTGYLQGTTSVHREYREYYSKSTRTWREYCALHLAAPAAPGPAARSWSQFPPARVTIPELNYFATSSGGVMCRPVMREQSRQELGVGGSNPCNHLDLDLGEHVPSRLHLGGLGDCAPSRLGLKARDQTFTARADRRVDQIGCDTPCLRNPTPLTFFASKLR
jgi:hypothetical protein